MQERTPRGGRKVNRFAEHTKGTTHIYPPVTKSKRLSAEEKRENRRRKEKKQRKLRRQQSIVERGDNE